MQQKVATIREVQTKDTSKGTLFTVLTTDSEDFATFNAGAAHQARGLINRPSLLTFNEKQVEKNGQTYTNRWFESAEPWEGPSPTTAPQQQPRQLSSARDEKSMQIMRECGSKVAVAMLPFMDDKPSPQLLIELSEWLVAYYLDGRAGVTSRANGSGDPGPGDRAPLTDEDIPF